MKALTQAGHSGRVPAPPEKRFLISQKESSQTPILENDHWKLSQRADKTIESLLFKHSNHDVLFFKNAHTGPSWYVDIDGEVHELKNNWNTPTAYSSRYEDIHLSIEFKDEDGNFLLLATIENKGNTPFQPTKLGIRLGIDTYMDEFPVWNTKLFPTLLRCEKTHFWGYFMSPTGRILSVISPDPIASWSHDYSKSWEEPPYQYNGHRITSVNLDLINALPLPERHSQDLWQVKPGASKTFRVYFNDLNDLSEVNPKVTELTYAPTINIPSTACEKGEEISFSVLSDYLSSVTVVAPNGTPSKLEAITANHASLYTYDQTADEGLYKIHVSSSNGKQSEANFYVRKPYSWYMQQAMQAVIDYPQKASASHNESWYGLFTTYAGAKHFPKHTTIPKVDELFNRIYPVVVDTTHYEPADFKYRIQNISSMIELFVDRYRLFNDENDLLKALKLSQYILGIQSPDGVYRSGHNVHYTCVVYTAKSLMELLEAIEPLRANRDYDQEYQTIYASVQRAMDELELNRADIDTEGELTFEDGMISCAALQLGLFALLQQDEEARNIYKNAALDLLTQHACLEQLVIPDARMRSGTLRFWEGQYDVLMDNNFFNSPHGWSSWSTYAQYYMYLLTGDTKYLVRTFNGLNAAMQMIDLDSGKLRWGFAVNPYLNITQIKDNIEGATPLNFSGVHYHAQAYPNQRYVIGEQYIDMVSHWFFANSNDNDVHEHFKCLEEIALDKSYVAENKNGTFTTYNCTATRKGDEIIITPSETLIQNVHLNLQSKATVSVSFEPDPVVKRIEPGMIWISR